MTFFADKNSKVRLLLLCIFACGHALASRSHPYADVLKVLPKPQMHFTRYSGQSDFFHSQNLSWEMNEEGRFVNIPEVNLRTLPSGRTHGLLCESVFAASPQISSDGESLFTVQQKFALRQLVNMETLKPNQFKELLDKSAELYPGQVNFANRTRDMDKKQAEELWPGDVRSRVDETTESRYGLDSEDLPIITATMASFSGQILNPGRQTMKSVPLPWQWDPNRAELSKNFDRAKYKYVWEWGRLAQDLPGEFEALAAILAAANLQELIALSGRMDLAYVVFHSMNVLNTKAYKKRFPGRLYPADHTDLSDALFLIPLSDVLAEFPPSRHSERLHQIIQASRGSLTEVRAIDMLTNMQTVRHTHLDQKIDQSLSPYPISIHDMSEGASARNDVVYEQFGFISLQDIDPLHEIVGGMLPMLPIWNSGQYPDLTDAMISQFYYKPHNAVEISNLAPELAKTTPLYVERVLLGVLPWYIRKLAVGERAGYGMGILTQLEERGVKFGITTTDAGLKGQIRSLSPQIEHTFAMGELNPQQKPENFVGREYLLKGFESPPTAFIFTIGQIIDIAKRHPMLYQLEAQHSMEEKAWLRQLMLSNPDIF